MFLPNWLFLSLFATAALAARTRAPESHRAQLSVVILFLFLTLLGDLGFQVGGDNSAYTDRFEQAHAFAIFEAIERTAAA